MFALYGKTRAGKNLVAIFSTKEGADRYLNCSLLKRPRGQRIFKSRSLLHRYQTVYVEEYTGSPVDPSISF